MGCAPSDPTSRAPEIGAGRVVGSSCAKPFGVVRCDTDAASGDPHPHGQTGARSGSSPGVGGPACALCGGWLCPPGSPPPWVLAPWSSGGCIPGWETPGPGRREAPAPSGPRPQGAEPAINRASVTAEAASRRPVSTAHTIPVPRVSQAQAPHPALEKPLKPGLTPAKNGTESLSWEIFPIWRWNG